MSTQLPVGRHPFLPTIEAVREQDCLGQAWKSGEELHERMMEMTFIGRIHRCSHLSAAPAPQMPDGPRSDKWVYQENVLSHAWPKGALPNSPEVWHQHLLFPIFPI